ncbi:MAG: LysE family translocator [Alphaproteobacteria bacterium]|nr:LysE family translocator [Alphaproteobacteria bacterium]
MSLELYAAYLVACVLIVLLPGPTMTLIIANSLAHGMRAGLLTAAGNQVGLALIIAAVAIGLASAIETMGWLFDWVRLAGAAYLVWLGWQLIRVSGSTGPADRAPKPRGGFLLQSLLVSLSNPKTLIFFGAFIPQFIDPAGDYARQIVLLGLTAMAVAAAGDSLYAILAGRAGQVLSQARVRLISRISGAFLIGGGIWLALQRR